MQYLLTEEEFKDLVPKAELIKKQDELDILVVTIRSTDFCFQHVYGKDTYCDDCPIANLKHPLRGYVKVCNDQHFSK